MAQVIVTGSIGVGKSTLIKTLIRNVAKTLKPLYFMEKFLELANIEQMLGQFYDILHMTNIADNELNTLQEYQKMIMTNVEQEAKTGNAFIEDTSCATNKMCILERSILDCGIFLKSMQSFNPSITLPIDIAAFTLPKFVKLVIFVETTVETAMRRITRRKRPGEEKVSKEYVQCLLDTYNTYAEQMYKTTYPDAEFLKVDTTNAVDLNTLIDKLNALQKHN